MAASTLTGLVFAAVFAYPFAAPLFDIDSERIVADSLFGLLSAAR